MRRLLLPLESFHATDCSLVERPWTRISQFKGIMRTIRSSFAHWTPMLNRQFISAANQCDEHLYCTLFNAPGTWVCPCSVLRAIGDKRYPVAGSLWKLLPVADPLFIQQAELREALRDEPVRIRIDPRVRLSSVSKSVPLSTHSELRASSLRALLRRLTSRPVRGPHSLPFASLPTLRPALVYQRSA